MIQQEVYCSFEASLPGDYFSKVLRRAKERRTNKRFSNFPFTRHSTFWDIGTNQKTGRTAGGAIWWVQRMPSLDECYRVIYYENVNEALNHYVEGT